MLDLTKPIRTLDGREVKQLTVFDGKSDSACVIYGVLDGVVTGWSINGEFSPDDYGQDARDLVNVPEEPIQLDVLGISIPVDKEILKSRLLRVVYHHCLETRMPTRVTLHFD